MTSQEIKQRSITSFGNDWNSAKLEWLKEIAYQLAVMNEQYGKTVVPTTGVVMSVDTEEPKRSEAELCPACGARLTVLYLKDSRAVIACEAEDCRWSWDSPSGTAHVRYGSDRPKPQRSEPSEPSVPSGPATPEVSQTQKES